MTSAGRIRPMRKVILAVALALATATAAPPAGVYEPGTPSPPSGYRVSYSRDFTAQGTGDWDTQPSPTAAVSVSPRFGRIMMHR
jgi:hypothetical protein